MASDTRPLFERHENDPHSKQSLRLWLRLLNTTTVIEKSIRSYLAQAFETTLPRFDLLAALDRCPNGLTMSELSDHLLVSNGNVTGLVARLQDDGMVLRTVSKNDRRTYHVKLTRKGQQAFVEMAKAHEAFVDAMIGQMSEKDLTRLNTLLETLQKTVSKAAKKEDADE